METVGRDAEEMVILGAALFFNKNILVIEETASYPMCAKNPRGPQMAICHLSRVHFQSVHRIGAKLLTYEQKTGLPEPSSTKQDIQMDIPKTSLKVTSDLNLTIHIQFPFPFSIGYSTV